MSMALIKSCGNCLAVHRVMAFVINSSSGTQAASLLWRPGGRVVFSDVKLIMHPLKCVIAAQMMGRRGRHLNYISFCICFIAYFDMRFFPNNICPSYFVC